MKKISFVLLLPILIFISCNPVVDAGDSGSNPPIEEPTKIFFDVTFISDSTVVLTYKLEKDLMITNIPIISKDNYNFIGWFSNNIEFDFNTKIISNTVLFAKFEERIFHTISFYDRQTLQATYQIEHGNEFTITEPINYAVKQYAYESHTPFTTYWKLNDTLHNVGDSFIVTESMTFRIFRKLDDLYTMTSDECISMSYTGTGRYYTVSNTYGIPGVPGETVTMNPGDIRFGPTWNFTTSTYEYMTKFYPSVLSLRLYPTFIVLISTNLTATTAQEFIAGLVQPANENYVATIERGLKPFIHIRDIVTTYGLQSGVNYRMWLATATYRNFYEGNDWDEQANVVIIDNPEEFQRNSFYTFNIDTGSIVSSHY